jgi:putative acetyltransferase
MAETLIRPFRTEDATETARVFFESVHGGTRSRYDGVQRHAWAPRIPDTDTWLDRLRSQTVFVAEVNGAIAGFMAMKGDGCIDLAYVAPEAMGRGIGKELYDAVLADAVRKDLSRLYAEASHIARPFFERQGWSVVAPQTVQRGGVSIPNFMMEKRLR